jgi:hypothetical protein
MPTRPMIRARSRAGASQLAPESRVSTKGGLFRSPVAMTPLVGTVMLCGGTIRLQGIWWCGVNAQVGQIERLTTLGGHLPFLLFDACAHPQRLARLTHSGEPTTLSSFTGGSVNGLSLPHQPLQPLHHQRVLRGSHRQLASAFGPIYDTSCLRVSADHRAISRSRDLALADGQLAGYPRPPSY